MNFSKIKKFLKIFKKGIDNLKNPCYNIITVKNTSRAERLISAESEEFKMYTPVEIFEMLNHASIIVGETKIPGAIDYTDVLHAFLRMENCGYHHSAKRHLRRFNGMPYGVYPYTGRFGKGYIVSHKDGIDYYLLGNEVTNNEKHFYSFF